MNLHTQEHDSTFQSTLAVGSERNNGYEASSAANGDKVNGGKSQASAEELNMSDIENASSSSPMSQMEIENNIANNVSKLIDGGLFSPSCLLDGMDEGQLLGSRNRACIVGAAVSIVSFDF